MSSSGTRVRKEIERAWKVLSTGEDDDTVVVTADSGSTGGNFSELMREIRGLKSTFKYYGPFKASKSIMGLDSRVCREQVLAID
jgi:hypothetical protein